MKSLEKKNSEILTTQDYFMFKPIKGNRVKNPLHLSRLKESMSKKCLFTVIIVNEKYEIIDGQHRFEVIRDLKLPLNFIICQGYGLNEVHVLNQNSKTWTTTDYMEGYCNLGNKDYYVYKDFKQRYNFGHGECMAMLTGVKTGGGSINVSFKNGLFKVTNLKEAIEKAEMITKIKDIYEGYNRRSFVYAMLYLIGKEGFDFYEFINKLKSQPSSLTDCTDTKQYLALIEEIYNYRRRDKINLRF